MRGVQKLGRRAKRVGDINVGVILVGVAVLFVGAAVPVDTARADDIPIKKPLAPVQPATGASLQLYIKVRNQQTTEYCKSEQIGVPRCTPGAIYEAKDICAPPYKVAAVSCSLADFSFDARLIQNASDANQQTGSCLWAFTKLPADKAPQATTTLLCVK